MLYTFRNQADAERFIDRLPFSDEEKSKLKSFFSKLTKFKDEVRSLKGVNSKNFERWFSERLMKCVEKAMTELSYRMPQDLDESEKMILATLVSQNAAAQGVVNFAKDVNVSRETLNDLKSYCEFLDELLQNSIDSFEEED